MVPPSNTPTLHTLTHTLLTVSHWSFVRQIVVGKYPSQALQTVNFQREAADFFFFFNQIKKLYHKRLAEGLSGGTGGHKGGE